MFRRQRAILRESLQKGAVHYNTRCYTLRTVYLGEIFTDHMEQRLKFVYIIYIQSGPKVGIQYLSQ